MILEDFLRCVFESKVKSKIGKNPILSLSLSLSLHIKRNARNQHHHHHHNQMEVADIAIAPLKEFVRDSARLVKKCTKPDRREFTLIASKTAFGASSRSFSSSSSLSFFSCPLPCIVSPKNVLSPPPSKHDRVYHVWVRRVLRETGLVSVSLRSLFALSSKSLFIFGRD